VDRIDAIIDKTTEEDDETYNDSITFEAWKASEDKIERLSAIARVLWKWMNEDQRAAAIREIQKGA
jgi:hypothetical protein